MFKKFISLGVLLSMIACFFCGCRDEPQGTFYSLQTAYEQGLLTQEDIKNIAYYRYDGKEWVYAGVDVNEEAFYELQPTDYAPIPKTPEVLSKETEKAIKESRAAFYRTLTFPDGKKIYPKARARGFTVAQYYGTYNDCVAIRITENYSDKLFDDPAEVIREFYAIADVIFFSSGKGIGITVWKVN